MLLIFSLTPAFDANRARNYASRENMSEPRRRFDISFKIGFIISPSGVARGSFKMLFFCLLVSTK
jgi:hypothetical protein